MLRWFLVLVLLLAAPPAALPADIRLDGTAHDGWSELRRIRLAGPIVPGDLARLKRLAVAEDATVVTLDSAGGSYREGLALAAFFAAAQVRTLVEAGDVCLSACAIAFLGGTASGEEGMTTVARGIEAGARVAFHAPFLALSDGALTEAVVERAYDHAIRTVTDFIRIAEDLAVPPDVAADMMTPQRDALYAVATVRDLVRIGVELAGVAPPPALTASMVTNLCLNGWVWGTTSRFSGAARELARVLDDTGWGARPRPVSLVNDVFGAVQTMTRFVLPVAAAGEGSGHYLCLVDSAPGPDGPQVSCRGYVFAADPAEFLAVARRFDSGGLESPDTPDFPCMTDAGVVPLARNAPSPERRWALVPEDTPVAEVAATLARYLRDEPPL